MTKWLQVSQSIAEGAEEETLIAEEVDVEKVGRTNIMVIN